MRKNTGTRTVQTTVFVHDTSGQGRGRVGAGTSTWTPEQVARLDDHLAGYRATHLELNEDELGGPLDVQVWEYEVPGLTVVAFVTDGTVELIITVSDDTVSRLHTAVRKARPVTVTYVTAEGEETVRTIEPRSVQATKGGDVIVKALDRKSGLHRSFRADRIRAYTTHRTSFLVGEPVRVLDTETGKARTISAADYAALTVQAPVPAVSTPLPVFYTTDPETAARWDDETLLSHLAEAWATGHTLAQV